MATQTKDSKIFLSIDPGFDSIKVVSNGGLMFKVPRDVVDITDSNFYGERGAGYLKAVGCVEGKEYLVGEWATRQLSDTTLSDNSGDIERQASFESLASFESPEMKVAILTCIGKALVTLARDEKNVLALKEREDGSFDLLTTQASIGVGVALPHSVTTSSQPFIKEWLDRENTFVIEDESGAYHITIKPDFSVINSQVILAMVGAITDEEGNTSPDALINVQDRNSLPAIVIDGGYRTLGRFLLTSAMGVQDGESNQTYAMRNIHQRVADKLRKDCGRDDITPKKIKYLYENNESLHYIDKKGLGAEENVVNAVNDEVMNVCKDLIDELYHKYNNLLEIKTLLVTGGTGAAYYEYLKKALSERRLTWVNVVLTKYEFSGKAISPEYAIAVGLYKAMLHTSNK